MTKHLKKVAQTTLSVAILIAALWFTMRDVNFPKLLEAVGRANYWWVAASLPLQVVSHYFRALRWVTLMKPIQAGLSVWNSFSGVMVSYMLNNIVPRSGEIARPLLLSRRENLRFSTTIASIVVERVLDVLSLCVFVMIMFTQLQSKFAVVFPDVGDKLGKALFIPLVGLMGGIVLLLTTNIGEWTLRMTVKRFSEPLYLKLHNYLEAFTHGFSIFKSPGLWWRVVLETIPIWIAYSVPMYLAFLAFGFDTRYGLTFLDANVMFTITTIAFLIAPTPGAFGVYHSFAQIGLVNLYGVQNEDALAFAFVSHGIGYISQVVIGGMFLLYEQSRGFNWHSVRDTEPSAEEAEASAGA